MLLQILKIIVLLLNLDIGAKNTSWLKKFLEF